jgi:hypothetical protein
VEKIFENQRVDVTVHKQLRQCPVLGIVRARSAEFAFQDRKPGSGSSAKWKKHNILCYGMFI